MLTNGLKMIGNDKKDINKYQKMLTFDNQLQQIYTEIEQERVRQTEKIIR